DAAVDFSFIRERVRHLYCEDNGRPSIDPELALRMFVLSYLYDISENRLCEEITMHAGYRWFCRLDFHDPVPDRTTLVKTRQRWGRAGVFADVMRHVVLACVEAGLVSADVLAVDGTLVKARAATKSLEAIQPPICLEEYLLAQTSEGRRPQLPQRDVPQCDASLEDRSGRSAVRQGIAPGSETSLHGSQPDGRSLGCDPGSMRHTLLGDGGVRGGAGDGTFGETHGVGSWLPAWRRQLHGRCVPERTARAWRRAAGSHPGRDRTSALLATPDV